MHVELYIEIALFARYRCKMISYVFLNRIVGSLSKFIICVCECNLVFLTGYLFRMWRLDRFVVSCVYYSIYYRWFDSRPQAFIVCSIHFVFLFSFFFDFVACIIALYALVLFFPLSLPFFAFSFRARLGETRNIYGVYLRERSEKG